nr:MAG TPA: hypothetical protein [Caudoviricetes sp.]
MEGNLLTKFCFSSNYITAIAFLCPLLIAFIMFSE